MDADHDCDNNLESESKRRKVRKGTKSCWECKGRKIKCVLASSQRDSEFICVGCQRRGTKCVSQEFEYNQEEKSTKPRERKGERRINGQERVARVEALVEQLIRTSENNGTLVDGEISPQASDDVAYSTINRAGIPNPVSTDSSFPPFMFVQTPSNDNGLVENEGKYEKLSHVLYDSLPSREDLETILKVRGSRCTLSHETFTTPYSALEKNGLKLPNSLLEVPGQNSHPVLIARYMLYVAIFLQHLHPDLSEEMSGLSEPPRSIMKRMAENAISLVTTNDGLLTSIEALECVMMESLYQADGGNLRRSWIAIRRAMVIAQLMNLHRSGTLAQYKVLDSKTRPFPQFMWFRIVFHDRHLCLMLGLTQGSLDQGIATDAILRSETPMGRLERLHYALSSRILERNESDLISNNYTLTQDLDVELQKAARSLPSKWWLMPSLASFADNPQGLFWEMSRLFNQLFHYNLLNQLHLPYMLRSSPDRKYEYSRMTCVNASREVLSRFIMFHSFNRNNFCCRTVDFFALMSGITLLLAHLESHRSSQTENLLAHQWLSDRAMIEQAQENMEEISLSNKDTLSGQSADLLRRLLAVESEAENGLGIGTVTVHTEQSESLQSNKDQKGALRVHIPYFGVIKIAAEGVISREVANQTHLETDRPQARFISMSGNKSPEDVLNSSDLRDPYRNSVSGSLMDTEYNSHYDINSITPQSINQLTCDNFDPLQQQEHHSLLSASLDDWEFQGVDMALFESLMKGAGNDENV